MRSINQIKSTLFFAVSSIVLCSFLIQKDAEPASMLFKVEKRGHKTAYVFGTSHLIPKHKFNISEALEKAMKSSNLVLMEVDMDDPMMPMDMASGVAMKNGMTISEMVNEADKQLIDSVLTETSGVGLTFYNTWKPILLTPLMSFREKGSEMASYDMTLVQMAKDKELEIQGLESIKTQMDLLDEIPYQEQIDDLIGVMKGEVALEESEELFELYAQQDVTGLYNFISKESTEEELEALVLKRNRSWIPVIEEKTKKNKCLIAFGAGHLGGKDGVLNLLKQKGFIVTPIAQ